MRTDGQVLPGSGQVGRRVVDRRMLDLEAVNMVMALARDGSLARASRTLGVSRTTLTRRVSVLEEALGVRLLERTQRHMRLTEEGRHLAQRGASLVDAARELEASFQVTQRFLVRIALPPGMGWEFLVPILTPEDEIVAGLSFEIVYTDREVHPIRDDFDLVVSFAQPTDPSLYARSLLRFPWCCIAAPAYLAARAPRSAAEVASLACIAVRTHGGVSPYLWPLRAGGGLRVSPWFVSTSIHASVQMVIAGRGIGLLPDLPSDATRDLVRVLPDEIGADGQVYLSMGQHLSDSLRGRRLKALIEKGRRYLLGERG